MIGYDEQLATFNSEMERQAQQAQERSADGESEMKLQRLVITSDSPFRGKSIQQAGFRQDYHVLVVGLEVDDSSSLETPNLQTPLDEGDVLWVVGEEANLARLGIRNT